MTDLANYLQLNMSSSNDQSHARIPGFIWDGWDSNTLGALCFRAMANCPSVCAAYMHLLPPGHGIVSYLCSDKKHACL